MSRLRIVFLGTAEFAVPSLLALAEAGHEIRAVVTQPDRPHGRGNQVEMSAVKRTALARGYPVLQPERLRAAGAVAQISDLGPDALALAAFGQIVPRALLELPPLGPINLHGSVLPAYRGAAPIQRAIMAGETRTGVTTMWMAPTLDTGDILLTETTEIGQEETAGELTGRLAEIGARLLVRTLDLLAAGTCPRTTQDDSQASYAPAITAADSVVRWTDPAAAIAAGIRALSPRPGVAAEIGGRTVKLWRAVPTEESPADAAPGTVLAIQKSPPGLVVAAGEGSSLLLLEAQPAGGRRMSAADWARGLRLQPGNRFALQPIA